MRSHKKSGTCIIALKNSKGKILIGADRRASWDMSKSMAMNKPKVRRQGDFIIAGTGGGALCSLFVDAFDPPEYNGEQNLDVFMHHTFHAKVKKLLLSHDYSDEHRVLKIPRDMGAELVVAIAGHVYTVDIQNPDDFSDHVNGLIMIDEVSTPYTTGCGGEHAKGAIDALMNEGVADTKYIAKKALEVAAKNSPGCGDGQDLCVEL